MNFNSRETYLVEVAVWKAEYAAIAEAIRENRKDFNKAQRIFGFTPHGPAYWAQHKIVQQLRSSRDTLRNEATALISERAAGKIEAQRQYVEGAK